MHDVLTLNAIPENLIRVLDPFRKIMQENYLVPRIIIRSPQILPALAADLQHINVPVIAQVS
jgi:hypothetical protein